METGVFYHQNMLCGAMVLCTPGRISAAALRLCPFVLPVVMARCAMGTGDPVVFVGVPRMKEELKI